MHGLATGNGEALRGRTIFTTGQVAKICKVAPRTVSKWFDSGRLRGYRLPGSDDRRIPREHLLSFLKENGMPCGGLDDTVVLALVGEESLHIDGAEVTVVHNVVTLGTELSGASIVLVNLDDHPEVNAVVLKDIRRLFTGAFILIGKDRELLSRLKEEVGAPCETFGSPVDQGLLGTSIGRLLS